MCRLRQSIEWIFGVMKNLWPFVVYSKKNKVFLSPVGSIMNVGALLTNVHTCWKGGSIVSDFFEYEPRSMEEYLKL
jgi:hypothetical protein